MQSTSTFPAIVSDSSETKFSHEDAYLKLKELLKKNNYFLDDYTNKKGVHDDCIEQEKEDPKWEPQLPCEPKEAQVKESQVKESQVKESQVKADSKEQSVGTEESDETTFKAYDSCLKHSEEDNDSETKEQESDTEDTTPNLSWLVEDGKIKITLGNNFDIYEHEFDSYDVDVKLMNDLLFDIVYNGYHLYELVFFPEHASLQISYKVHTRMDVISVTIPNRHNKLQNDISKLKEECKTLNEQVAKLSEEIIKIKTEMSNKETENSDDESEDESDDEVDDNDECNDDDVETEPESEPDSDRQDETQQICSAIDNSFQKIKKFFTNNKQ